MANIEHPENGSLEFLGSFLYRNYPDSKIWLELPYKVESDGTIKKTEGKLGEKARLTERSRAYFVDDFETVLNGRRLFTEPEVLFEINNCAAINVSSASPEPAECGKKCESLVLDNGRENDMTHIIGACSPDHASNIMSKLADKYYDDGWEMAHVPVFGVLGEIPSA